MIVTKEIKLDPCEPYRQLDRVWDWNAQNILIQDVNFPQVVLPGDCFYRTWSDREYTKWQDAAHALQAARGEKGNWNWAIRSATEEQVLDFIKAFASEEYVKEVGPVTGGRISLWMNVSNGHETYAIDVFHLGKNATPIDQRERHWKPKPVVRHMSNNGFFYDEL